MHDRKSPHEIQLQILIDGEGGETLLKSDSGDMRSSNLSRPSAYFGLAISSYSYQ